MFKYRKHMQAIQFLVGNIGGKKTKERFETILEPLQAIIQIACLAYYPIGSKLAIHNNILVIQHPGYTQNVKRWYNNDKKEDVFYLYNVFSRFNKFYKNVLARASGVSNNNGSDTSSSSGASYAEYTNSQLFALLHDLAKTGINNLIRTYNQTDKIHILHTLQMYKGMLDSPELVRRLSNDGGSGGGGGGGGGGRNQGHSNNASASGSGSGSAEDDAKSAAKFINDYDERDLPRQFPLLPMSAHPAGHSTPLDNLMDNSSSHIDSLFIKITDLYSQDDFDIIYHTLMKIQNDTQYFTNYVDGLNKILEPVNIRIKKWIDDNIVF
jgi:hypothetical protein